MSVSSRENTPSDSVADRVNRTVGSWPNVSSKTMFGRLSFLTHDTLFAFIDEQTLVLTEVGPETRLALTRDHGAHPFRAGARVVYNWLAVPVDLDDLEPLVDPLSESYEAARRIARERSRRR